MVVVTTGVMVVTTAVVAAEEVGAVVVPGGSVVLLAGFSTTGGNTARGVGLEVDVVDDSSVSLAESTPTESESACVLKAATAPDTTTTVRASTANATGMRRDRESWRVRRWKRCRVSSCQGCHPLKIAKTPAPKIGTATMRLKTIGCNPPTMAIAPAAETESSAATAEALGCLSITLLPSATDREPRPRPSPLPLGSPTYGAGKPCQAGGRTV